LRRGSIENRARLLVECTDAAISVYGAGGVAARLSPCDSSNGVTDCDPDATFGYLARELGRRKLAFLAARQKVGTENRTFSLRREMDPKQFFRLVGVGLSNFQTAEDRLRLFLSKSLWRSFEDPGYRQTGIPKVRGLLPNCPSTASNQPKNTNGLPAVHNGFGGFMISFHLRR
jgi:hypothetical protein